MLSFEQVKKEYNEQIVQKNPRAVIIMTCPIF